MRAAPLVAILAWQIVQLPSDVKPTARAVDSAATPLPQVCQGARDRAAAIVEELSRSVPPAVKAAAEQYIRKPAPGVSPEKARNDFAAGTLLMGDTTAAAWTALGEPDWTDETFATAGVYLFYLDKPQDALQSLTCAYMLGNRSALTFEAIATVQQSLGHAGEARQAIQQAKTQAPEDRLIETEASLMTTGQPPAPAPPDNREDGLDAALRELADHANNAVARMKADADVLDQALPDAHAHDRLGIAQKYFEGLLTAVRDQIRIARDRARNSRTTNPKAAQFAIDVVYTSVISGYAQITDALLSFSHSNSNSTSLLFWSEVLGLDPSVLARESGRDAVGWETHSSPALARGAFDQYDAEKKPGWAEYLTRERACRTLDCKTRENARWCMTWKPMYDKWADASRVRHNKAARTFDRIATRTLLDAEAELLQTRAFAVRQLAHMNAPGSVLDSVNGAIRPVFERHLGRSGTGTSAYLLERARWFEAERLHMEETLATEGRAFKQFCQPAIAAYFELLAQEEWQAYLDHLRDRIAWDIQGQGETNEFPCEAGVGPVTLSTDLNKPGEGRLDLKWGLKDTPFSVTGSARVRADQTVSVGISGGVSNKWRRDPSSDNSQAAPDALGGKGSYDSVSGAGVGSGGCYGPFCGKARVTFTSKVSPWNSNEYLGIKLKGSAGLSLRTPAAKAGGAAMGFSGSVACYPSTGSVTFYPRALYEDAVKYMSTPSAPPRR